MGLVAAYFAAPRITGYELSDVVEKLAKKHKPKIIITGSTAYPRQFDFKGFSQIAKKVKLSKPSVEYRLNRFDKNNIIFSYYTVIDFTKIGYFQYKVYFKFQNTDLSEEKNIIFLKI